jgi:hypothetical protein
VAYFVSGVRFDGGDLWPTMSAATRYVRGPVILNPVNAHFIAQPRQQLVKIGASWCL